MIQELLAVTTTSLNLINQAAFVTSAALGVVGTTVQAGNNIAGALEKSTRVLDKETQNLLNWHDIRLVMAKHEQSDAMKELGNI